MNIPEGDLHWIDKMFRKAGCFSQKSFRRKYSKDLNVLFHIEDGKSRIDRVHGHAYPRDSFDDQMSLTPSHYRSVELGVGKKTEYTFAWAIFLHELGHIICGHMDEWGRGPSVVFQQEIEAWRFSIDHWDQVPTHRSFPYEKAKECLSGYYDWKQKMKNE